MTQSEEKLQYYQSLPYKRIVYPMIDDNGAKYFVAQIFDIPECIIDGDTPSEAMLQLNIAFDEYIISRLELNYSIAEPKKKFVSQRGRKQKFNAEITKPLVKKAQDTYNWKDKSQPTLGTTAIPA